MREFNFDGLVGPTHNYAGLSHGNVASQEHAGQPANPLRAVLQGIGKMRFVAGLGAGQAVLPPQPRPDLRSLRRLGFTGSDEEVLANAASDRDGGDHLLRLCSSAAAMWTANAATSAPSADASDGRLQLVPANLTAMFHRALEAETTTRVLRAIFADERHFVVHDPLPGGSHFADEGAANHTRLFTQGHAALHLFAWGRRAFGGPSRAGEPMRFPARQTLEASQALARLVRVQPACALFPQQDPRGIDAGAFHTDVLAVGSGRVLLLHELAFVDADALVAELRSKLGAEFCAVVAREAELPVASAVAAYPFNSQLLMLAEDNYCLIAPEEARENPHARAYLSRVLDEENPVRAVHHLALSDSMQNGGGPACLRQRIVLSEAEQKAIVARVFADEALLAELETWAKRHYRDRLSANDLRDAKLHREVMTALDELTRILQLGPVYDFQLASR